jgi:hypothetical protein
MAAWAVVTAHADTVLLLPAERATLTQVLAKRGAETLSAEDRSIITEASKSTIDDLRLAALQVAFIRRLHDKAYLEEVVARLAKVNGTSGKLARILAPSHTETEQALPLVLVLSAKQRLLMPRKEDAPVNLPVGGDRPVSLALWDLLKADVELGPYKTPDANRARVMLEGYQNDAPERGLWAVNSTRLKPRDESEKAGPAKAVPTRLENKN